jgi:hypothetical protein
MLTSQPQECIILPTTCLELLAQIDRRPRDRLSHPERPRLLVLCHIDSMLSLLAYNTLAVRIPTS